MKISKIDLATSKFAFLNINREVDKHLVKSVTKVKAVLMPILAIEASKLSDTSFTLKSVLDDEPIEGYPEDVLVVLDGQHRVWTALTLLREAKFYCDSADRMASKGQAKKPKEVVAIESIIVNIIEDEDMHGLNIGQYIHELNSTSKTWSASDVNHSMWEGKDKDMINNTFHCFEALGFSITTISLYLTGKKSITKAKLSDFINYNTLLGVEDSDCIRAAKIYLALRRVGFTKSFLTKRYIIEALYSHINSGHLDEIMSSISNLNQEEVIQLDVASKSIDICPMLNALTREAMKREQEHPYASLYDEISDEDALNFILNDYEQYIDGTCIYERKRV